MNQAAESNPIPAAATNQELRASELNYRRLFETAQDGILILDAETGRVNDVNPFLIKLLGFTHGEMVGKTVGELSPFKDLVSNKAMLELLQKDRYVRYHDLPLETKDGRKVDVEFVSNVYQVGDEQVIQCNIREITERKRMAQVVRESEEKFRHVFDNSPLGKSITLPSGEVSVNRAFCELLGYTREELASRKWQDLTHPDDVARTQLELELLLAGEKNDVRLTKRLLHKNGSVIWIELSTALRRNAAGQPLYFMTTANDITERKRAEESVHESQAMLQSILQSAPVGIGIVTNRILGWTNEKLHAMTGYSSAELEGQSSRILYPSVEEFDQVGRVKYDQIRQRGTGMIETRWKRKDGQIIDVLLGSTPIKPDDLAKGVTFAALDITDRKLAKAALHESEEQFRTMADAMPQLAWIAKADGFIYWYNQRWYEYTGTTPAQMEGWGWQSVHDPAVLPQVMERWQGSIASGKPFDMQFPLRGADGYFHTFLTRVQPLKDSSGQVVRWYGTNTDVEPMKQAEAAHARLTMAVEQAAETIVITDTQGKILYANPAFEKSTGYTCAEALGQSPRILKSGKQDDVFYRQLWETLQRGEV